MGYKREYFLLGIILLVFVSTPIFLLFFLNGGDEASQRDSSQESRSLLSQDSSMDSRGPAASSQGSQEKEQVPTDSVFESFKLSPSELNVFYERRYEPRSVNLAIEGLKIDKKKFEVQRKEDLPQVLIVPLPGGEGRKEFTRSFVDFKSKESFVWVGVGKDKPFESFHLSFYQGVFIGGIETRTASYEIKYLSDGKHLIRKIDQSQFPENENDFVLPKSKETSQESSQRNQKNAFSKTNRTEASNKNQIGSSSAGEVETFPLLEGDNYISSFANGAGTVPIDMVVGFSYLITESEGNLSAAKAFLNLLVNYANTTHRNSETGALLHVTEMVELNVSSSSEGLWSNLDEMYEAYAVEEGGDGYNPNNAYHILARKRYQTKSDLTVLVTERYTSGTCGIAYLMTLDDTGFYSSPRASVTAGNCPIGTLTHEIGHNLGAHHARDQLTADEIKMYESKGLAPYAYGIRVPGVFRTIMSYSCSSECPRINYFSDPEKKDIVTGTFLGEANRMDNARTLRERSYMISFADQLDSISEESKNLPKIFTQPQGGHVPEGDNYALRVLAGNLRPPPYENTLDYQWYRDGVLLSGANKSELLVTHIAGQEIESTYYVEVSNSKGSASSQVVTLDFRKNPQIVNQPQGGDVLEGGLILEVEAIDPNPPSYQEELSYQWYRNGRLILGEEEVRLFVELDPDILFDATYYVVVSHSVGETKSDEVTLNFIERPRSGQWDFLLHGDERPLSDWAIGKIDRGLGINELEEILREDQ